MPWVKLHYGVDPVLIPCSRIADGVPAEDDGRYNTEALERAVFMVGKIRYPALFATYSDAAKRQFQRFSLLPPGLNMSDWEAVGAALDVDHGKFAKVEFGQIATMVDEVRRPLYSHLIALLLAAYDRVYTKMINAKLRLEWLAERRRSTARAGRANRRDEPVQITTERFPWNVRDAQSMHHIFHSSETHPDKPKDPIYDEGKFKSSLARTGMTFSRVPLLKTLLLSTNAHFQSHSCQPYENVSVRSQSENVPVIASCSHR